MAALQNDTLFRCPTCHGELHGDAGDSYACSNGHTFTVSEGVVDLVPSTTDDTTWKLWEDHLAAFQKRREDRVQQPESLTTRLSQRTRQQAAFADFVQLAGTNVLDIGCGPGRFREQLNDARYIGVDPIPLLPDVLDFEFARAISETLPFADDTFSDVVVLHALDHVNDVATSLEEIRRVLAPDGRLHILQIVLDKRYVLRWLAHEVKDFLEDRQDSGRHDETPHHMTEFDSKMLRSALEPSFTIVSEKLWSPTRLTPMRMMVTAAPR